MSLQPSRRGFLAGVGVVAGAGCVRRAQETATSVDYPETAPPTYRRWLPAPAALPGDVGDYDVMYVRLADVLANDDLPAGGASVRNLMTRTGREPLGIDPGRVEAVVSVDLVRATVLQGSFDAAAVGAAAGRAGYRPAGGYRGVDCYEHRDRSRAVAVSDGAVVQTRHDRPVAFARRMVDADRGDVDRYHEVDAAFERMTDATGGTATWVDASGALFGSSAVVRAASDQQYIGDRAFFARPLLFESADDASEAAVRKAVAGSSDVPRTVPLDVTVDGRFGRAEYARDVEAVFEEDRPLQPIVAWNFDYDAAAEALTVTHRAGDEAAAERLTLRTDDGPTDRQFADAVDTVAPGDAVTVSLPPATGLRVVWAVGRSTATVGRYPGEE